MIVDWKPIKDAPKIEEHPHSLINGPWIFARNMHNECRVIRWTTEYPCTEGVWMFAYEPTDYIDGIQSFAPVEWDHLPEGVLINDH